MRESNEKPDSGKDTKNGNAHKTIGDYIHISTLLPLVIAVSVVLFAAGIVVWATQIKVEMNVDSMAFLSEGTAIIPLDDNYLGMVQEGQDAYIGEYKGIVTAVRRAESGMYYCIAEFGDTLPNGVHNVTIMTSNIRPIEMIFSVR